MRTLHSAAACLLTSVCVQTCGQLAAAGGDGVNKKQDDNCATSLKGAGPI